MHADIVRAVEFLVVEVRGEHVAAAIGALADQRRRGMLADDQVKVGVIGHAIAFVRRTPDLDDAARCVPATANVAGHVRKQQIMIDRMPDRPLGEGEAAAELADRRIGVDQFLEFGAQRGVGHGAVPSPGSGRKPAALGQRLHDRARHLVLQPSDDIAALDLAGAVMHRQQKARAVDELLDGGLSARFEVPWLPVVRGSAS